MSDYKNICSYLDECITFGKRTLSDFGRLLDILGSPHKKIKAIHVAGTNAKGSTCTYISQVLISQGFKTGLFTSPHLSKYNERMKINNEDISDPELWEILKRVKTATEENFDGGFAFFQIITAVAFLWFAEKGTDYAVIETGLGGRLDATNIIEEPILSVITNISLDHTAVLGNTLEEIAGEKGGIIKKNCPCVLYFNDEKVYNKIRTVCLEKTSRLYCVKPEIRIKKNELDGCIFDFKLGDTVFENVESGMSGEYQPYNASNSIAVCLVLKESGIEISTEAIYDGIKKAIIFARTETVCKEPYVILDGAHNDEGTKSLGKFIKSIKEKYNKKVILLMGMLSDKKNGNPFDNMARFADRLVITSPNSHRRLMAEELFSLTAYKEKCIFTSDDLAQAYETAYRYAKENDCILVCGGSLYLMGELREHIFGGKR